MRRPLMIMAAGAALMAQSVSAAPPPARLDPGKADVACLIGAMKIREAILPTAAGNPQKQKDLQNLEKLLAFYAGKLSARYPGQKALVSASKVKFTPQEAPRYADMARCSGELRTALGN